MGVRIPLPYYLVMKSCNIDGVVTPSSPKGARDYPAKGAVGIDPTGFGPKRVAMSPPTLPRNEYDFSARATPFAGKCLAPLGHHALTDNDAVTLP